MRQRDRPPWEPTGRTPSSPPTLPHTPACPPPVGLHPGPRVQPFFTPPCWPQALPAGAPALEGTFLTTGQPLNSETTCWGGVGGSSFRI